MSEIKRYWSVHPLLTYEPIDTEFKRSVVLTSDHVADKAAALRSRDEEIERLRFGCSKMNGEVCETLGRALGYPWLKDDQKNFPGATEADGVCVGEHVAESIAMEAARRIERYKKVVEAAKTAYRNAWNNGHYAIQLIKKAQQATGEEAVRRLEAEIIWWIRHSPPDNLDAALAALDEGGTT